MTTKPVSVIATLLLPILAFPLGWVYVLINDLLGFFSIDDIIPLSMFTPLVYACIVTFILKSCGCRKGALLGVAAIFFGIISMYANWFWFVHSELGVWVFGIADLLDGMRICADMRSYTLIHFITVTSGGLMFFYWVEAAMLAILMPIIIYSWSDTAKASVQSAEKDPAAKATSLVVAFLAMSLLLSGCSGSNDDNAVPLDEQQLANWASQQNWAEYPDGASQKEFEYSTGSSVIKVVVGVGVAAYPPNEKFHEANIKRTFAIALWKLPKLDKDDQAKGVVKAFSGDVEFADGKVRRVTALAKVK